jgi:lysophospholipase L1-like esterase
MMKTSKLKKFVSVAVLLSLTGSIFLNLFLYSRLRKYYALLYAVELDPLGLSYVQNSADQQKFDDKLPVVVFFGDSRAAQWPNPQLEEFSFVNRGIGNQTSAQVISRFDDHVKPLRPDIIVIQVGINDLKTIPLFPERKQEIISNCESNIEKMIQNSVELDSTVIITTIFPTGEIPFFRRLVWTNEIQKALDKVNSYIRNLAHDDVIILDSAGILSNTNGQMRKEYSLDELHLNEAGYEALNLELTKILKRLE